MTYTCSIQVGKNRSRRIVGCGGSDSRSPTGTISEQWCMLRAICGLSAAENMWYQTRRLKFALPAEEQSPVS